MTRRLAIVAIIVTLASIAACALILTPGKYGMVPAGTEQNAAPE